MAEDTVQVDPDQLKNVEKRFHQQAELVNNHYKKILAQVEVLKNGAWIGQNADEYVKIMEETLLPAVARLHKAFETASNTTSQVAKVIHDADEQNKGLFPS